MLRNRSLKAGVYLIFFLALILPAVSCSREKNARDQKFGAEASQRTESLAWPALALLKTGRNPLWFELGDRGPSLVESPSEAALTPYVPWPHARFVVGMQFWKGFLVMAVNRDGFIALEKGRSAGEAVLYRVAGVPLWDPYTAESFFLWDDKPAVLLYRNDFFADSAAPSPKPQVYVLDFNSPFPASACVPALETFPEASSAGGISEWEAEVLRRGPDGLWYYRMKEKLRYGRTGKFKAETAYFRSGDLAGGGMKISVWEWRNSSRPEGPEHIPRHLAAALGKSAELGFGKATAVKTISPDFEEERIFSLSAEAAGVSAGENENPSLLFGFCASNEALAVVISQDGRGLYSTGNTAGVFPFSLPPLPEGFAYTGAAVLGNVLIAAWEEQQEAGIGAAGFMALDAAEYWKGDNTK